MAANIEEINYNSNSYTISFYGSIADHVVTINSFDENNIIDYDVLVQGNSSNTIINTNNETIEIENIGSYSLANYETYTISINEQPIKNIMPIIVAHHLISPNSSLSFIDNGDNDNFDPDPDNNPERRKFFGGSSYNTPCVLNSTQNCNDFYVFWTRVSHKCESGPC